MHVKRFADTHKRHTVEYTNILMNRTSVSNPGNSWERPWEYKKTSFFSECDNTILYFNNFNI